MAFERLRFKDTIVGKDDAAGYVVLELSNVPRPAVTNHGTHGFLRDGFDLFVHRRSKLLNEVLH